MFYKNKDFLYFIYLIAIILIKITINYLIFKSIFINNKKQLINYKNEKLITIKNLLRKTRIRTFMT